MCLWITRVEGEGDGGDSVLFLLLRCCSPATRNAASRERGGDAGPCRALPYSRVREDTSHSQYHYRSLKQLEQRVPANTKMPKGSGDSSFKLCQVFFDVTYYCRRSKASDLDAKL